jgi:hypothetical protein
MTMMRFSILRWLRRRSGLVSVLALTAALMVSVPGLAWAESDPDVARDCTNGGNNLDKCDFTMVAWNHSEGEQTRISDILNNCGSPAEARQTFTGSVAVQTTLNTESGYVAVGGIAAGLGGAAFGSIQAVDLSLSIHGTGNREEHTFSMSGTVPPEYRGWVMWAGQRRDVSGYFDAWYGKRKNGHFNWFYPELGGTGVHMSYPEFYSNGIPAGRLWLHAEPCGSSTNGAPVDTPLDASSS